MHAKLLLPVAPQLRARHHDHCLSGSRTFARASLYKFERSEFELNRTLSNSIRRLSSIKFGNRTKSNTRKPEES